MKTLTVGDLHGKDVWKEIDTIRYDKIIFVGDYVDCFTTSNVEIKHNLEQIIRYKKDNMDKVVLLLGNHDVQYTTMSNSHLICSGYRPVMLHDLYQIFYNNYDIFQIAYQIDNYLWTHAGVHEAWHEKRYLPWMELMIPKYKDFSLLEGLEEMYKNRAEPLYDVGYYRGGRHPIGGPLWLDQMYGREKPLKGYHQIVGHSKVKEIKTHIIDKDTSITFTDILDSISTRFYELNIK